MKAGIRTVGQAQLEIVVPMSVPQHLRDTVREVHDFRSATPKQGHGTALMQNVCAEADRDGKVLMLMVNQPDDAEMTTEALANWYGRFGFKPTKDGFVPPVVMVRRPEPLLVAPIKRRIAEILESRYG